MSEGHRMRPVDIVDLRHDIVIDPDLKAAKLLRSCSGRHAEITDHRTNVHCPGKRHLGEIEIMVFRQPMVPERQSPARGVVSPGRPDRH